MRVPHDVWRRGTGVGLLSTCRFCGCSDFNACVDLRSGQTCAWVMDDVCSFCAGSDAMVEFLLLARFAHENRPGQFDFTPADHAAIAEAYERVWPRAGVNCL